MTDAERIARIEDCLSRLVIGLVGSLKPDGKRLTKDELFAMLSYAMSGLAAARNMGRPDADH